MADKQQVETKSEQWRTVDEVAAVVRLHPRTVYRLANEGVLRSVKLGRTFRFPPGGLDDLVKQ